tara:strand:- start:202 stop:402 length:201 start_codon:yes stop_codon:yes gene_type:complete
MKQRKYFERALEFIKDYTMDFIYEVFEKRKDRVRFLGENWNRTRPSKLVDVFVFRKYKKMRDAEHE